MRVATVDDVELLVGLMAEFYAEAGYPLNRGRAAEAFERLLADKRLGIVWIIEAMGQDVGYVAVTLGFSLEYGGLDAVLDDLFIRAPFRGAGLGTGVMARVRDFCRDLGVRSMHLEVARDNAPAQAVYRRAGFGDTDRQLLTLRLADPTHEG